MCSSPDALDMANSTTRSARTQVQCPLQTYLPEALWNSPRATAAHNPLAPGPTKEVLIVRCGSRVISPASFVAAYRSSGTGMALSSCGPDNSPKTQSVEI